MIDFLLIVSALIGWVYAVYHAKRIRSLESEMEEMRDWGFDINKSIKRLNNSTSKSSHHMARLGHKVDEFSKAFHRWLASTEKEQKPNDQS